MTRRLIVVVGLCLWPALVAADKAPKTPRPTYQELSDQNDRLFAQVKSLTAKLAAAQAEVVRWKPTEVRKGMPLADAEAIAGNKAVLVSDAGDAPRHYNLFFSHRAEEETYLSYDLDVSEGTVVGFVRSVRSVGHTPAMLVH